MTLWNRLELWLAGLFGACALLVEGYQVFGRYIDPQLAITWGDEVIVYLIVWAIFLSSSQLVRTDGHVRPDLVLRLLPARIQRWVEIGNCLVAIGFCIGLTWLGFALSQTAFEFDDRSSTGLSFPMWLYYAALPTGAGLMSARYLFRLYRYIFHFDPATMTIGVSLHS